MLHNYTLQPMCLPSFNVLQLIQFQRYSPDKSLKSRSLQQGRRSNQGHTVRLQTSNCQPISLLSNTPPPTHTHTPYGSVTQPEKFLRSGHYSNVKGQIKVTSCPYQALRSDPSHYLRYSQDKILKVSVTTARSKA